MILTLRDRGIQTVVLDIEGTTTPVGFVYDTLFPYARRQLRAYVREHLDEPGLREPLARLREEWAGDVRRGESPPDWQDHDREERISGIASYLAWLMDHDRKSPVLKTLQGEIWARGYADRSLRGEVFADVPQAMARWRAEGIGVAIYSSGSVLAQRLLFQTTDHGDLTTYIGAFFDTGVGPKREADSYRRIAATLGSTPETLLFLSDTPAELQAARAAGFNVRLCVRPPHDPPADDGFDVITDFSEVL